ncbi:hypothetical protein ACA910_020155 [Epithemia clementina (nom. ined.)]
MAADFNYHEDYSENDDNEVHPLVEHTIAEGTRRRHSRHSFCLTGDFVMDSKDILAILQHVDSSPIITRLVFVQTRFTLESMDILASFLEGQHIQEQSAAPPRIKKLIFSSVLLMDDIASRLFESIARNRSLHELVFHDCCFDVDAVTGRKLSTALPQNPGLKLLNFASHGSTEAGIFYITCALKHITELNLSDCELDCSKARVLFEGLANMKSLRKLDLSKNDIRASGLGSIARFLARNGNDNDDNNGLRSLSLASNTRLFDNAFEQASKLAQSLCVNRRLKRLVFERCGLVGQTVSLLFRALEVNQSLEELNVQINSGIAVTGYESMIRSIPLFKTLRHLTFDALQPQLDQQLLLAALQQNTSLTKVVPRYGLDPHIQAEVKVILQRNRLCHILQLSTDSPDPILRGLAAVCVSKELESVGSTSIFSLLRSSRLRLHGRSDDSCIKARSS